MLIKFSESRGGHICEGGMEERAYLKGLIFSFFQFWPQNNIVLLPVHVKQTVTVNKTITIRRKPNLCVITFSLVQFPLMSPILSSHSELLDCVFSDFSFLGEG